jgi:Ca-activated chloride channel family protein
VGGERPHEAGTGTLYLHTTDDGWASAPALETDVELRVTGIVVRARVVQRFANPTDRWSEGIYVFPLPELAAVDHLEMRVGDRVIEGRILERERARKTYARAKRQGRKASLVEQRRPNLFTTSLANLGPGEEVEVAIEYQETLRYEEGRFRLRFPMVAAPRYVPRHGKPAAAPDGGASAPADRDGAPLNPTYAHPADSPVNRVRVSVELEPGFPLASLASPTHVVVAQPRGDGRHDVYLEDHADRDFVLEWRPRAGAEPTAALFSEERDGEIHALLLVMPPDADAMPRRLSREIVFVIDTSGSMLGPSLDQAKRALLLALERLGPEDSFNLIRFADDTQALFGTSVPVDPTSLERARRWLRGLDANGGTEMLPALRAAFASDRGAGDLRQVVFVTDGSIANEEELFAALDRGLGRSRLFPVGIGAAPNGFFLTRAAKFGRGSLTLIATPGEVDERMNELFRKLESPVLSDIEVHWNDRVEMWPARIPDLYAGEPLVVTARLPRFAGEVIALGRRGGRPWEVRLPLQPGERARGIGVLWARRKIAALMESRARGADAETVRREVVDVSLRHHLVSRYTSLVAVETTPERPPSEPLSRAGVAANLPAGTVAARVGVLPRGATASAAYRVCGLVLLLSALCAWRRPR